MHVWTHHDECLPGVRGAQVAELFAYQAYEEGHPPVLWCIRLDPRGAANVVYRPKQVPSTHTTWYCP
jgi:hypothetical protein